MKAELIDLIEKVLDENIDKLNMNTNKLAQKIVESINSDAQTESPKWVNDFAVCKVIRALKSRIEELENLEHTKISNLIEELRLKLIGMECFVDEYCKVDEKTVAENILQALKKWINKKRKLYS